MNILIIHRENENQDHINIVKNALSKKGVQSKSLQEDKDLQFTSHHNSWIRDCISGYDSDGNKRYNGFILIGKYMDKLAEKFVSMAIMDSQEIWFIYQNEIKKLTKYTVGNEISVVDND